MNRRKKLLCIGIMLICIILVGMLIMCEDIIGQEYDSTLVTIEWELYTPQTAADSAVTHLVLYRMASSIVPIRIISSNIPVVDSVYSFIIPSDGSRLIVAMTAMNPQRESTFSNADSTDLPYEPIPVDTTLYPPVITSITYAANSPRMLSSISVSLVFETWDRFVLTIMTNSDIDVSDFRLVSETEKFFDYFDTEQEIISPNDGANNDSGSHTMLLLTPFNASDTPIVLTGDMDNGTIGNFSGFFTATLPNSRTIFGRLVATEDVYVASTTFWEGE